QGRAGEEGKVVRVVVPLLLHVSLTQCRRRTYMVRRLRLKPTLRRLSRHSNIVAMRTILKSVVTVLALGAAAPAFAQVDVQVHVATPVFTFAAPPPLVVVTPGVQVVPDYDREVFFVNGFYWCHDGDQWFRARDHRGGWAYVERRQVPVTIVQYEPGR